MKLLNKYLISLAALSFAACSSMDVDDSEIHTENFPDDFEAVVYMELHPELISMQVMSYISDYNAGVAANFTAEQVLEDSMAFVGDTSLLRKIYTTPMYGGSDVAHWEESFAPTKRNEVSCEVRDKFTVLNVQQVSGEDTTLIKLLDPITMVADSTDSTKIVSVSGKTDSAAADVETFVLSDTLFLLSGKKRGTTVPDTVKCDTTVKETPGSLKPTDIEHLASFNFIDTRDDWNKIKSVPLDTLAIILQYPLFGESHGWPYRKCKDSEKKNAVFAEEYPVKKHYCVDSKGVVREIK